jgi:hypothetical protein
MIVRFQILTVASMNMRTVWDIAPCSLGADGQFGGVYCLHHQGECSHLQAKLLLFIFLYLLCGKVHEFIHSLPGIISCPQSFT